MNNLMLCPGLKLIWRDIHRQDSNHPADTDVAGRAAEFLYESVTLDHRLTLGDVFGLLNNCPPLRQVFRRDFAEELCAEAGKGPLQQSRGSDPEELAGVECLMARLSPRNNIVCAWAGTFGRRFELQAADRGEHGNGRL